MRTFSLLFLLILLAGCVPMLIKAKRYSGDGVFSTCSNLLAQGYSIEFSRHPSDKPFSATYKLSHVPDVGHDPLVYLRVPSDLGFMAMDAAKQRVTASFHVVAVDGSGTVTRSLDLPLSTAIWTDQGGAYGAYRVRESHFHFAPTRDYTLRVSYEPGPIPPPAKEVYVQIDGCAWY